VNANVHSEISAIPAERLAVERELLGPLPSLRPSIAKTVVRKVDRLSCVRFGSARYSVPNALIGHEVAVAVAGGRLEIFDADVLVASHLLVAPGEVSLSDEHYGGPRPLHDERFPRRPPRRRRSSPSARSPSPSSEVLQRLA
jgi:hypothetical protein